MKSERELLDDWAGAIYAALLAKEPAGNDTYHLPADAYRMAERLLTEHRMNLNASRPDPIPVPSPLKRESHVSYSDDPTTWQAGDRVLDQEYGEGTVTGWSREHDCLRVVWDKDRMNFPRGIVRRLKLIQTRVGDMVITIGGVADKPALLFDDRTERAPSRTRVGENLAREQLWLVGDRCQILLCHLGQLERSWHDGTITDGSPDLIRVNLDGDHRQYERAIRRSEEIRRPPKA